MQLQGQYLALLRGDLVRVSYLWLHVYWSATHQTHCQETIVRIESSISNALEPWLHQGRLECPVA
jgi:hypothetical protein